jgi:hypothetical protein
MGNSFSKNEIIMNTINQGLYLDENEINSLQFIQDKIREYILLHSLFFSSNFYFGGVFIFLEKMI